MSWVKRMFSAIEHLVKEIVALSFTSFRLSRDHRYSDDLRGYLKTVRDSGCVAIPGFWDAAQCGEVRKEIDRLIHAGAPGHHWHDPLGSDKRVFYAERANGHFGKFLNDPTIEQIRRAYTGGERSEKLVLAARMDYVHGNTGSGNGWHRDSPHRSQFKAIMYLSDCAADNGPFQYVARTHKPTESIMMLLHGLTRSNQYRFSDGEIDQLVGAGYQVDTWTGTAGTLLLVDTKGLHRGSPIRAGSRHALTLYTFEPSVPRDFLL
jgi:hypothetical protein